MGINISLITIGNNQNVIRLENEFHLYSYDTYICSYNSVTRELILNSDKWDYSNTTRKYFKLFLEHYTTIPYINKAKFLKEITINEKIVA